MIDLKKRKINVTDSKEIEAAKIIANAIMDCTLIISERLSDIRQAIYATTQE